MASQEDMSDTELLCVADTMLHLGTEIQAPNTSRKHILNETSTFHKFS